MFRLTSRRTVSLMTNLPTSFHSSKLASTLALLETSPDGNLDPSSLNLLQAAKLLKNPITALFVGPNASTGAQSLKDSVKCEGLSKIVVVKDDSLAHYLPENISPLLVELLKGDTYSHFVITSSSTGKNILPRLAALIDNQPVCDVVKIEGPNKFVRPIYAGNALATIETSQDKKLLSVRASAFDSVEEGKSENVEIVEIPFTNKDAIPIKWLSANLTKTGRPDLGSAKTIVSGGRAFKDKESFEKYLTPLADVLDAGIGATRAAVDNGLCDNSLQIGQTGKIVAPNLYIAVGLSGAVQHLAGMKDSGTIVAINNDPDAPIFKNATYGLEGDVLKIVPELTEKIKAAQK
ncbi:similar to Saccharomyces cerevisiae YPR004C AIM45 Putative ortholog of mammalian electron transfer flavoprotein complex subunit ETF-alpha [Maudiozyma barnettii]|uniref:Probable electron transfer flavoprotein subunit alpha n=1 Tax=Maudiozyma barnettii TaxID=61262 RepID=A0A8H2VEZ6_9SACH|nr:Aim45p [Kazachstania barnettii]CAB4254374.1 similar to Saccharomyces cerevisiae YPR004C AIM45 Putative ortholog of mammalian electron transfer flavoprotein complex subunit ETF-alpha [Kazachstania barnettii]CAD1782259.1 similar to Saccharomyces cerevisiae YPR004C AIM45 Putative ortholog of mammalian electron transfer flavoprotein complex subunit ETF-alpha [Kazachstania barnettii]